MVTEVGGVTTVSTRTKVSSRRGGAAVIAVLVLVFGSLISVAKLPGLRQPELRPAAAVTDVPVSADALPTVQIDGVVWSEAMARDSRTVYAVGTFSTARPAGSAPGKNTVPRRNFVAFDITTGVMTTFDANLNSTVRAVAVAPNGTVYVGGDFTTAKGVARNRIAAFTPAGALIGTFKPSLNGTVRALAATDTAVFVGGSFTTASGVGRSRLAAFNATSGAVLGWNPNANDQVTAMVLAPDASRVVVGGKFVTIGGASAYGLGSVNTDTGKLEPFAANATIRDGGSKGAITALSTDGTSIYGTGYAYGPTTSNFEGTFSANPNTGKLNWMEDCHGDSYGAFAPVGAGVVYTVSHHHDCSRIAAYPQMDTPQRAVAFTNEATQKITTNHVKDYADFAGQPAPTLLSWFPKIDAGTFTGQGQGAWSITGTNSYLAIGGEFPTVNGRAQQGLVRFAVRSAAPNAVGPTLTGASITPTLTVPSTGTVKVTFPNNWDRDDRSLTWRVIRDGSPVATGTSAAVFWKLPPLSTSDTAVPAGTHTYRVEWVDGANNVATSGTASVTVSGGGGPVTGQTAGDTFSRTVSGGFGTADVGGPWTPTNAATVLAVGNGAGQITLAKGTGAGADLGSISAAAVDTTIDFALSKVPTAAAGYVYLDARTGGLAGYRAKVTIAPGGAVSLRLVRVVNATETAIGTVATPGISYTAGTALRLRLQVSGSGPATLQAKVWVRSAAEPAAWTVSTTDTNGSVAGSGGVAFSGYLSGGVSNAPIVVSVDNLAVRAP